MTVRSEGVRRIFTWYAVIVVVLALCYLAIFAVDMSSRTRGVVAATGFFMVAIPWFVLVVITASKETTRKDDTPDA